MGELVSVWVGVDRVGLVHGVASCSSEWEEGVIASKTHAFFGSHRNCECSVHEMQAWTQIAMESMI